MAGQRQVHLRYPLTRIILEEGVCNRGPGRGQNFCRAQEAGYRKQGCAAQGTGSRGARLKKKNGYPRMGGRPGVAVEKKRKKRKKTADIASRGNPDIRVSGPGWGVGGPDGGSAAKKKKGHHFFQKIKFEKKSIPPL